MGRRVVLIVLVTVLLLVVGGIYYACDPSSSSLLPRCTFLSLTGYKCPGCGSQRALHALLHGDLVGALGYNAMLVMAVPWVGYCLYAETKRESNPRLYVRLHNHIFITLFLAVVLLWWVLRNIFNW